MKSLHTLPSLLLTSFTLFTALPVSAEIIQLNQNQFRESLTEDVNISGSVRVGVMYQSSAQNVKPDTLFINVGERINIEQMLCVKIISNDGRYGADFQYELTENTRGLTHFQFPSQFKKNLASYTPEQMAVLADIKPACKGKSKRIVPASWGKPTTDSINVFLNSGVSTTHLKLYPFESNNSKKIPCQTIESEKNTAYDTKCHITDLKLYDLSKTKVIRKNFGSYLKPLKLKIYAQKI